MRVSTHVRKIGKTGAVALALFVAGNSTIGYQDILNRLAHQPGVAERARISILGEPVRLLKASTFSWPSRSPLLANSEIAAPPQTGLAVDINRDTKTDRLALPVAAPLDSDPLAVSGEATPPSLAGAGVATSDPAAAGQGMATAPDGPSLFAGAGTDPLEDDDSVDVAGAEANGLYSVPAGDPTGDPDQLEHDGPAIELVSADGPLDEDDRAASSSYGLDPALPLYRQSAFIFGLDEAALPPQPFLHMASLPSGDSGTTDAEKAVDTDLRLASSGPSPAERLGLAGKRRDRAEKCLAEAVYFESRGEPKRGQIAVAQVVMNRVFSGYYPADICRAVYQNAHRRLACQFTFACDNIRDVVTEPELWTQAREIAADMLDGRVWDEKVGRATHYHARSVRPNWIREMRKLDRIGEHTFYRPRRWTS